MNKKKILVTGANGYIGNHLVAMLCDQGFEVIANDINKGNIDKRAAFVPYDIFSTEETTANLYELFHQPQICVHLAWGDGFNHNALSHINHLPAHFHFLRNLVNQGVNHLAVAGSFREYGNIEGRASEDHVAIPANLYSLAKTTLKDALTIELKDKDVIFQWLRPFSLYGDDHQNNSVLSKILNWDKEGKTSFPFTDGIEKYDYIHINRLAEQIIVIISQREIQGIINCCSGEPTVLRDLIEKFLINNQLRIKPEFGKFPKRDYDSKEIYGDNTKIQKIFSLSGS